VLRLLLFVGVGLALGGGVVLVVGPPGAAGWAVPVGLTLAVLAGVLVAVGRGLRGLAVASPEEVDRARAAGRLALARVDVLRQTGTQVNDQPLCELDLTVAPRSGAAFTTTARLIVPLVDVPRFQPGRQHVVALLTDDGPELAFTEDDPSELAWRTVVVPPRADLPDRQVDRTRWSRTDAGAGRSWAWDDADVRCGSCSTPWSPRRPAPWSSCRTARGCSRRSTRCRRGAGTPTCASPTSWARRWTPSPRRSGTAPWTT
jgi:hypothetical protein